MTQKPVLKFIIVGASIAGTWRISTASRLIEQEIGLSSAIGLKRSGHNVLVLEKQSQLGSPHSVSNGGVRLPPNGCKVLFDWGMEAQVRTMAAIGRGFDVYRYEGNNGDREYLGKSIWPPEITQDPSGGDFLQMKHNDLLRILYDTATNKSLPGNVTVNFKAEVLDVNFTACSVTLASGEVHSGDVLIGADGAHGHTRRRLRDEQKLSGCDGVQCGLAVYSTYEARQSHNPGPFKTQTSRISTTTKWKNHFLSESHKVKQKQHMVTFWMGSNRVQGKDKDLVFWIYSPDASEKGTWTQAAERKLTEILGPCDNTIMKLGELADPATCVQIESFPELEWVSKSGKAVVVGAAAHPLPIMSLHSYSMALEDSAFIGQIFSHSFTVEDIPRFLHAYEESRKERCSIIDLEEKRYIQIMSLPDGDEQHLRDETMRANTAAGKNVLEAEGDNLQEVWERMTVQFGYNAADAADEWWMKFGRLLENRAGDNGYLWEAWGIKKRGKVTVARHDERGPGGGEGKDSG
ncbi:hypothetical protein B0H14DRAFT_3146237 [Mycena olivaceomarginata]|nr:hypothetical protein B0H14DRAFT_3146237 [Mycena olivaceomarginata]